MGRKSLKVKTKDVRAAAKRGLVKEAVEDAVAPRRHYRICPATGERFMPWGINDRGFICACTARTFLALDEAGMLDRTIHNGDRVVHYWTGEETVVEGFASGTETQTDPETGEEKRVRVVKAVVTIPSTGEKIYVDSGEVEKIQHIQVDHTEDCIRNRGKRYREKMKEDKHADAKRGETDRTEDSEG